MLVTAIDNTEQYPVSCLISPHTNHTNTLFIGRSFLLPGYLSSSLWHQATFSFLSFFSLSAHRTLNVVEPLGRAGRSWKGSSPKIVCWFQLKMRNCCLCYYKKKKSIYTLWQWNNKSTGTFTVNQCFLKSSVWKLCMSWSQMAVLWVCEWLTSTDIGYILK